MDARRRRKLLVALPLLIIQVVAGGAVALVHAREVQAAPAALEAAHDGRCPVVHDPLRCALCHSAAARVVAQRAATLVPSGSERVSLPAARRTFAITPDAVFSAQPRAPPPTLS